MDAIHIARYTKKIIWQNIAVALGVKLVVVLLAVFGLANMWMAIFADEGVALLAILNAMRVRWYHSPERSLPEALLSRAVRVAAR